MNEYDLKEKAKALITKIGEDFGWENIDSESDFLNKAKIKDDECKIINLDECSTIFDILGEYKKVADNQEGEIWLYDKCIRSYAKSFYKRHSERKGLGIINEEECVDLAYTIVLWHELGHWITHWMKDSSGNRWNEFFWKLEPNPNDLLEGLAQLITYYAIINETDNVTLKKLKFMFEDLLIGQTVPYHKHVEFLKHRNFSWSKSFKSLELIRQYNEGSILLMELFKLMYKIDEEIFNSYKDKVLKDELIQTIFKNTDTLDKFIGYKKSENECMYNFIFKFIYEKLMNKDNKYKNRGQYAGNEFGF